MSLDIFGYLSQGMLAICGLPQAYQCIVTGHGEGISKPFIWLWFIGEIGSLIYTILKVGTIGPFMLNYGLNITIISIILKYIYYPRIDN